MRNKFYFAIKNVNAIYSVEKKCIIALNTINIKLRIEFMKI